MLSAHRVQAPGLPDLISGARCFAEFDSDPLIATEVSNQGQGPQGYRETQNILTACLSIGASPWSVSFIHDGGQTDYTDIHRLCA